MKELSIEEKAKRYDSAIKRAKNTIEVNQTIPDIVDCVKSLFPELAKSEDERIRNFISNELTCLRATEGKGSDRYEELTNAIAWLEKQGKKEELDEASYRTGIKHVLDNPESYGLKKQCDKDKFIEKELWCIKGYRENAIKRLEEFEEQSEQKTIKASYTTIVETGNGGINAVVKRDLSADKVEPKFKVGEWIIFDENHNSVYQVERIDNYRYYLRHYLGGTLSVHFDNELIRKWTIQDAKDGDVLCTYECGKPKIIFILKGTPKKHYALGYHCFYNIMYSLFDSDSEKGCLAPNDEDVKPATKEQRDLLFKKIEEAGYNWNSNKKELEKVEKKVTPDIEIPFGSKDSELIGETITIPDGCYAVVDGNKVVINKGDKPMDKEFSEAVSEKIRNMVSQFFSGNGDITSKEFTDQFATELLTLARYEILKGEKWSEDDNTFFKAIIRDVENIRYISEGAKKDRINWIKSLKGRIMLQLPKEWSEEDEDNFKHLLDEIVCLGNDRNSANRLYYDRLIKFIEELKNRAQPKEKWCDKDERMLDRLIAYFEKQVAFTDDDNPRYANWLKSLKDRYTWKPSDKQIYALRAVVNELKHSDNKYQETIEDLYNDLEKLMEG